MEFTADLVWACAVAAHNLNGGYYKESVYNPNTGQFDKQSNKLLVKQWLRDRNFDHLTENDYEQGREFRNHFKTYLFRVIAGTLTEFQQVALKIAQKEEFTSRDMYDFSVISCLPNVALNDRQQSEIKREMFDSEQLNGAVGETVVGDINVITCRYVDQYGKYRIQARMGESFVDFWFGRKLEPEHEYHIKGKIRTLRNDHSTQLNYVKMCK